VVIGVNRKSVALDACENFGENATMVRKAVSADNLSCLKMIVLYVRGWRPQRQPTAGSFSPKSENSPLGTTRSERQCWEFNQFITIMWNHPAG